MRIPVVVQYRHVHLSVQGYKTLFGEEEPTILRPLSHHEQVVLQATVTIETAAGILHRVRVLGPVREETQVELSATDAVALNLRVPLRVSGDTQNAASCTLRGPKGSMRAKRCVIIPARHLHLNPEMAKKLKLSHGQIVSVRVQEDISRTIDHVTVRVHPTFVTEFHLTTDEAAELWLENGNFVEVCL